jgi:hypothetical protein
VLAAPIRQAGTMALSRDEAAAVLSALGSGTIVLCEGLGDDEATGIDPRSAGSQGGGTRRIRDFADAAAVAAAGPVILVVRVGRTPESGMTLAVTLLQEAGGTLAGTVAVCSSPREASRLWC